MFEEFKKFAMRGNVVDLAVGVIIGAAFGAIVNSLVGDLVMPLLGAVTGGLDFSNYFLPLSSKVTAATLVEAKKQGAVFAYGSFLTVVINFIIIAFALVRGCQGHQSSAKAGNAGARRAFQRGSAVDRNPRHTESALSSECGMATKLNGNCGSSPTIAKRASTILSTRPWRRASP